MACHDGVGVMAEPSLSYRRLAVIPVLSLYRRWNAGCDRLSEVTQYGPVESASGSVGQDGPRFTAKAFD